MKKRVSRRNFIIGLSIFLFVFVCTQVPIGLPSPPDGWQWVTWHAGYGSWIDGGFAVSYSFTVTAPVDSENESVFVEKITGGWIGDDLSDDLISMEYNSPGHLDNTDLQKFISSENKGYPDAPISVSEEKEVVINGEVFRRVDLSALREPEDGEKAKSKQSHPKELVKGFWLHNDKICVLTELVSPERLSMCEQIVSSFRRTYVIFPSKY